MAFLRKRKENIMLIQIFGPGCARCEKTHEAINNAVRLHDKANQVTVEKITDPIAMMQAGILSTPAIAINGKIVLSGRIPSLDEAFSLVESGQAARQDTATCTCGTCHCSR